MKPVPHFSPASLRTVTDIVVISFPRHVRLQSVYRGSPVSQPLVWTPLVISIAVCTLFFFFDACMRAATLSFFLNCRQAAELLLTRILMKRLKRLLMAAGSTKKNKNLCASRPRIRKDDRLWQSPAGGICSAVVPPLSLSCRAEPNRSPFFLLVHFFGRGCFRSIPVLLYYSCRKHQRSNFDVHQQR